MRNYLDFEQPIAELEGKIEELRHLSDDGEVNIADEVSRLQTKADKLLRQTYTKLSPWQKVQVARHPNRPHFCDYVEALIDDYMPLAGDRAFADDKAIQGGLGRFRGRPVVVMGHEKGADTTSRVKHNFGMARPEGYRKAIRLMELAERFKLPVLTFVDTSGAYPGVGAEERGQAEAIARSIETCLKLNTPIVSTVIGEGGSGGAIAIAAADSVLMLEHAVYSVISPEGCAAILWGTADQASAVAEALKITAQDLTQLGCVDAIIPEPVGGAHRDIDATMKAAGDAIEAALSKLTGLDAAALIKARRAKYVAIGREGLNG
ncbi:acetyl-CoA carboxylase carboxyltransferase subunit alpha [Rhodospirillaceae bacterium KN72]|uniref:Acetyl-coenzyme A carboxylase carboxyl transferase subunit alpha n=1 Tax=Pacificispira spongiicola TaxID=2729598 RepID=A0A7Y0HEN9_9PROT|nr:acetyl-CoA carboxylase carboxyltransferase subunit alpha [Pacificispira spongiicola]NMM44915.1 acetyl-CoA carboxylase carboxyltransferase subunit alpha [Pacificispira spongiicola]